MFILNTSDIQNTLKSIYILESGYDEIQKGVSSMIFERYGELEKDSLKYTNQ